MAIEKPRDRAPALDLPLPTAAIIAVASYLGRERGREGGREGRKGVREWREGVVRIFTTTLNYIHAHSEMTRQLSGANTLDQGST